MNPKTKAAPGPKRDIGDVYQVLFRQKWKIIGCALLGVLAAAGVYVVSSKRYQSEARLLVRYVFESRGVNPLANEARAMAPATKDIMNSEILILTSWDLAQQVVDALGAEKLLEDPGSPNDRQRAAGIILGGLTAEALPGSTVIQVTFQHRDPELVQPVLTAVIETYFKRHAEIHRATGSYDEFLQQQTDSLRARLAQTEEELRKAKDQLGVISLEEAKANYTAQIGRLRQDLLAAEADLAERKAMLQALNQLAAATPVATNAGPAALPAEPLALYRAAGARLQTLWSRQQELELQFTEESPLIADIRDQIAAANALKQKLELEYPQLLTAQPALAAAPDTTGITRADQQRAAAQVTALESRVELLRNQLAQVRQEASSLNAIEASILELQRRKELQETNYRYFAASLEQARFDEALTSGKVSNIKQVQAPTPPAPVVKRTYQLMAGAVAGGIALGLAWAFATEWFLDRSLKRPVEIERHLNLPLFLSIPRLGRKQLPQPLPANGEAATSLVKAGADRDPLAPLRSFHDALRDRLMSYFEAQNLTHKPKLVAVTGCARGAGVTTTAVGLARSLSETGDGNVLLVDMTQGQGAARYFHRGQDAVGIKEALETPDSAIVQDKLYVVAEGAAADKLNAVLPKRFGQLVPKFKLSEFDYVIFDMPPITQTSITPRIAGHMDMVMLVLEAEKDNADVARRAAAMLAEANAKVGTILNKTHNYIPRQLHQDYLSET